MSLPYWHSGTYAASQVMIERVQEYRVWVQLGWASTVRDAHAQDRRIRRGLIRTDRQRGWQEREAKRRSKTFRTCRDAAFAWPRRCAYCGDRATVLDHIVPRSRGGADHPDNYAPACSRCNLEKGPRTPTGWRLWREAVGLPWPPPGAVWTPEQTRYSYLYDDTLWPATGGCGRCGGQISSYRARPQICSDCIAYLYPSPRRTRDVARRMQQSSDWRALSRRRRESGLSWDEFNAQIIAAAESAA